MRQFAVVTRGRVPKHYVDRRWCGNYASKAAGKTIPWCDDAALISFATDDSGKFKEMKVARSRLDDNALNGNHSQYGTGTKPITGDHSNEGQSCSSSHSDHPFERFIYHLSPDMATYRCCYRQWQIWTVQMFAIRTPEIVPPGAARIRSGDQFDCLTDAERARHQVAVGFELRGLPPYCPYMYLYDGTVTITYKHRVTTNVATRNQCRIVITASQCRSQSVCGQESPSSSKWVHSISADQFRFLPIVRLKFWVYQL